VTFGVVSPLSTVIARTASQRNRMTSLNRLRPKLVLSTLTWATWDGVA
jgi:hypothetical protein